jgi:XTP/dITP diphosphohydrolase
MLNSDVIWKCLADFPPIPEVEEDGETFTENARKKALGYAKATGLWTIADDSGLCVDVLDGAPGVNSARFSGEKSKDRSLIDHANISKLLKLLKDVPKEKRTARFVCSICLATVEGFIIDKEVGENGFGYDPVFFVPFLNKTVAQLEADEKNAVSHRGNAIRKLKPLLARLLKQCME